MDILLNEAPCGYFSITDKGLIQSVNQTLLRMLGYDREELLERHIESTMSVANKMFFHTYFYPYIQLYGQVNEMYLSFRTKDGKDLPVLLNGIRRDRDGKAVIECVALEMRKRIEHEKDIMKTKQQLEALCQETNEANHRLELLHAQYEKKQQKLLDLNEKLETLASTDPLTGLRNRRYFQEQLQKYMELFEQSGEIFSLCIIDIDRFKAINDTYGHPVGDLVLTRLAQLLQEQSYGDTVVARFGGEEFVILLPGLNQEQVLAAAERYRSATETTPLGDLRITISIGAATCSPEDTELSLLQQADQALYISKHNGRNRVTHYNAG
ncbi:PAS domain S-box-containing protein/diguanylate cyclase (GGDEF) domain-containing protein [Paenibacillus catalpae]|uniref:PAS domain S-box-containing protein/diguanylate cyclase (GGDEF) domain-containing protein n=1 Tax=Paenibacillus catalpae TaxID=1045775 RepID=A0A1I2D9Q9_9BACL|nr:sensor domain-containing diguanylate cyclase [Paenibacillus catalpae]SFE77266.1 PAS domain S-box-containing protein/diguanylate cyclase (GGDEF) domain-containing protein [Paenibacillus catalpae]